MFRFFCFLSLTMVISVPFSLSPQNKYAGEFLSLGAGARASALGGAQVAFVNDVTAGYYNPAGLMHINNAQVAYNHTKLFIADMNYDYGAFAVPWGTKQSLGFSVLRLAVDNIAHTEAYRILPNGDIELVSPGQYDPATDRTRIKNYFNYASYAFLFSYARHIDDQLTFGANVKLLHNGNRYASANGVGFDAGVQYAYSDAIRLGATLHDATGTLVAWNTGKREWIYPSLKTGAAYVFAAGDDHLFIPMLDIEHRFENRRTASQWHWGRWSADIHAGLEYQFKRGLFLRAGYNELSAWTLGTGIKMGLFRFDYTFTSYKGEDALNNIHRIYIQFDLKTPRFLRTSN